MGRLIAGCAEYSRIDITRRGVLYLGKVGFGVINERVSVLCTKL